MLSEVTGIRHNLLFFHSSECLNRGQLECLEGYIERRLKHEPYQYIFGHAEFRELDLSVGRGCLIPRPETEYLVDIVKRGLVEGSAVCELGVGSGAISLSLGFELPGVRVYGVEKSELALSWAEGNLARYGLKNVEFFKGDLFSPFAGSGLLFDCIVGNLPYIAESEELSLPLNVRNFEPREALFSYDDGLGLTKKAIIDSCLFLKPGGFLIFETGEEQGEVLRDFALGYYSDVLILRDQYKVNRYLYML